MKRNLSIVLLFIFCLPLLASPFSDISQNHWAYKEVKRLAEKGIIQGIKPDHFAGNQKLTRYQAALMVARLLESIKENPLGTGDMKAFEKLLMELSQELALLGVRVSKIDDEVKNLQKAIPEVKSSKTLFHDNKLSINGDLSVFFGVREYENDNGIPAAQWAAVDGYGRAVARGNDWENEFKIGLNTHLKIDEDITGFLRIRGLGTMGTAPATDDLLWSVFGVVGYDDPRVPNLQDMTLGVEYAYIDIKNLFDVVDARLGRQNVTFGHNLIYAAPTDAMSFTKVVDQVNLGFCLWDSNNSYFDNYRSAADIYTGTQDIPNAQQHTNGFDSFGLSAGIDFGGHALGGYYISQSFDYYDPYLRSGDPYAVKYGVNNTAAAVNGVSANADFSGADYLVAGVRAANGFNLPSADPNWWALTLDGNALEDLDYFAEFMHYDSDLHAYTTNGLANNTRTINTVNVQLPGRELDGNAWILGLDWDFHKDYNLVLQYGVGDEDFVPSTIDTRQIFNGMLGRFGMQASRATSYWGPTGSLQGVKDLLVKLKREFSDKTNGYLSYENCRENDSSKYIDVVETSHQVYGTPVAAGTFRVVETPSEYSAWTAGIGHQYRENTRFSLTYQKIMYDQDRVDPDGTPGNADDRNMNLAPNAGGWYTLKGAVEVGF